MGDPTRPDEGITTQPDLPATSPEGINKPSAEEGITTKPYPSADRNGDDAAARLMADGYRTSPDHENTGWPPGVPYIIGNEACERFSFYGMNAILAAHLASLYVQQPGMTEKMSQDAATSAVHLFKAGVYALPMIGAILAERLAGKYRTIFYLSLVYCLGHAALSLGERYLEGMFLGLALIAIGSGGIKPCVSANVGDQFGKGNWFRVRTVYQIFYFSINFGSFFSTLLIPWVQNRAGAFLIERYPGLAESFTPHSLGTSIAFGIPGVLMFIATIIFWMGRRKFVHVPPKPGGTIGLLDACSSTLLFLAIGHLFISPKLITLAGLPEAAKWPILLGVSAVFLAAGLYLFARRQTLQQDDGFLAIMLFAWKNRGHTSANAANSDSSWLERSTFWGPAVDRFGLKAAEGPVAVLKIISVFFLISVFWALFDQHSSSWIFQAGQMDLRLWGDRESFLGIGNIQLDKNQVPALNPLMVMGLIPLMNFLYLRSDRLGVATTPLRRITAGMFCAALSFVVVALLQIWIDRNESQGLPKVWFAWQIIPYLVITVAEVMVSITGLEFAYTQAPARMKSTIMGFWLLTVALGNVLVAFLAGFENLARVNFFWTFAGLSFGAALLFSLRSYFYVQKDYTQE
ncbi:MAG: MFS transporter [Planctomycetia bacterium]|nr:MFS transporter [Planctomycetia bacterium]